MNRRAGTVISETWEDGQAIKDLNVHLVCSNLSYLLWDEKICESDNQMPLVLYATMRQTINYIQID